MVHQNKLTHSYSRRTFLRLSSLLAVGSTLIPLSSLAQEKKLKEIKRTAFTMGSIATITAYSDDEQLCNIAFDEAFAEMKATDRLMSVFDDKSQLSLVNRHSYEKEIQVDGRIIDVLKQAQRFYELTNGAFDVTIEPLMELYGFRDENIHRLPSDKELAQLLGAIGMKNVIVHERNSTIAFNNPKTKLDFGGIAVGYAIDTAVSVLKSYGIESALINHSGDIYALGSPPDENGWEIGITNPLNTEEVITKVQIKDQALSTSGNYENFILSEGETIGHLLNPASGKPASTILSGTTIADTAIEADALSTGFFILGIEKTKNIIHNVKDVRFIAVVQENEHETLLTF